MSIRVRKVIVQCEVVTDASIPELKGYFDRLNGPYHCMAFRVDQVQVNVIKEKKKKKE